MLDQPDEAFLADETLERRHQRLKSLHDLRLRVQDRFANVAFIHRHRRAIRQLDGLAPDALQRGAAPLPRIEMAGVARQLLEQRRAALGERAFAAARQPALKCGRLHDDHRPDHARVVGAAILRAEDVIGPGSRGLEPELHVAAGDRVDLGAEGREVQAVQDILDVTVMVTGRPAGTCSSLISRWPSRCWNFHIHCLPTA